MLYNIINLMFQNVAYDKEGSALRIRGKNILENEHVKVCIHQLNHFV